MDRTTKKVMFSSNSDEWETPQAFFKKLNQRYGPFTLDPCANGLNSKCSNFFTEHQDGLKKDWSGNRSFVNPPYSKIKDWVRKAYEEGQKENTSVVLLIPSRTDTKYFREYCMKADRLYFIEGRLKFKNPQNKKGNTAPFPSLVCVFDGSSKNRVFHSSAPIISTIERI
jgi:phage N-6-adenine-methyltransferase